MQQVSTKYGALNFEIIKKMLCLRLFVLILGSICIQQIDATPSNPKIVIIGAGPSGLAAATKLIEYGFKDITILEAESRIGGRIHTIPFADNFVDLGAQWCHGEKDNVVYEMVEKLDLLQHSDEHAMNFTIVRSNGEIVDNNIEMRLVKITDDIIAEGLNEWKNYNDSLGKYVSEKYKSILNLPENQDIDKVISEEFLATFDRIRCSAEGSDTLSQVSARSQVDYKECEGDSQLNWKDKGYKAFLEILLKTKETGKDFGVLHDNIKLSKKVKQTNWKRDDEKVLINTEDGEEILADHVIVTVSLGVLKKQHDKLFEPALPAAKLNAIKNIGFGTVNKMFLEFEQPFWPSNWDGVTLLWRNDDIQELEATQRAWLEDMFGFYKVASQPRILSVWIVGPHRPEIENLTTEEAKNASLYLLTRFLPKNTFKMTEPIGFVRTTWASEPNFRGSYSYHSMETTETGATNADLAEPLFKNEGDEKPLVQFAGEATHSYHYSTVHGAVESGFREAKRLKEFYKKLDKVN